MMRALLAAAALLALLLPAPGAGQAEAWYNVDGVDYYYATGTHASGHLAVGADPASQAHLEFSGCGWAKLRPDLNKGRIQALGTWGTIPVTIDLGEFQPPGLRADSIAPDATVPASASGLGQPLPAGMAATANATLRLGPLPIDDPVTGAPTFQGTWFVTPRGYRDDASGAVQPAAPEAEDWEMHLRLGSHPGAERQGPAQWTHAEPSDGTPYLVPEAAHARVYTIPNQRLFGTATLSVEATSLAPEGSTRLDFTVYAPDGAALGNLSLAPALNGPAAQAVEFPLDQFGDYHVEVHGPVSLATYEMAVQQEAPDALVLDLWWDDVAPGYAGLEARNECRETLDGPVLSASVEPRPPPVPFDWKTALFTVGAGVTLLAVAAALAVTAYNMAVARRAVQS